MKCLKTGLLFQWNGETRCGDLKAEWLDYGELELHVTGISQFTETVRPPECVVAWADSEQRRDDWTDLRYVEIVDMTPELKAFLLKWSPAEAAAMGIRSEE